MNNSICYAAFSFFFFQIYDAVALCEYLMWLEENVPLGRVSEISGSEVLKGFRLAQPTNKGLSFGSISASGPNGAIIHYGYMGQLFELYIF